MEWVSFITELHLHLLTSKLPLGRLILVRTQLMRYPCISDLYDCLHICAYPIAVRAGGQAIPENSAREPNQNNSAYSPVRATVPLGGPHA